MLDVGFKIVFSEDQGNIIIISSGGCKQSAGNKAHQASGRILLKETFSRPLGGQVFIDKFNRNRYQRLQLTRKSVPPGAVADDDKIHVMLGTEDTGGFGYAIPRLDR